jgi:hypothetical protein
MYEPSLLQVKLATQRIHRSKTIIRFSWVALCADRSQRARKRDSNFAVMGKRARGPSAECADLGVRVGVRGRAGGRAGGRETPCADEKPPNKGVMRIYWQDASQVKTIPVTADMNTRQVPLRVVTLAAATTAAAACVTSFVVGAFFIFALWAFARALLAGLRGDAEEAQHGRPNRCARARDVCVGGAPP